MTKEQAEVKLPMLPLIYPVEVSYGQGMSGEPVLQFSFTRGGLGMSTLQVPLLPNEAQIQSIVFDGLPLAHADKLASLAIMLSPPQPA
jgi:hypothetical protein